MTTATVTWDDALTRITAALTDAERDQIADDFCRANPSWRGAGVDDIIDTLWQGDAFLGIREPFMDANPDLCIPAGSAALLAVILLDRRPVRDAVVAIMHRAGLAHMGREDVTALLGEVREMAERTTGMMAIAAELGSPDLAEGLDRFASGLDDLAGNLTALAAAAHPYGPPS